MVTEKTDNLCDPTTNGKDNQHMRPLYARDPLVFQEVYRLIVDLHQRNQFWDQIIEMSSGEDTLQSMKSLIQSKHRDVTPVKTLIDNQKNSVMNCDNEANHLLNKLRFINELMDGKIATIKDQINSFQMKDFQQK